MYMVGECIKLVWGRHMLTFLALGEVFLEIKIDEDCTRDGYIFWITILIVLGLGLRLGAFNRIHGGENLIESWGLSLENSVSEL